MSIARVQTKSVGQQNTSSASLTFTSTPTNGNALVMMIGLDLNTVTVSSITQTGATWARILNNPDATRALNIEVWAALNVSGVSGAASVTLSGTTRNALIACEYSGVVSASVLDVSATNAQTLTANPDTGTTASTAQAIEVWVGGLECHASGTAGDTFPTLTSPTNGFSIVDQQAVQSGTGVPVNRLTAYLEKIVAATGTANCSCSLSAATITAYNSVGLMVALKGVAPSTSLLELEQLEMNGGFGPGMRGGFFNFMKGPVEKLPSGLIVPRRQLLLGRS